MNANELADELENKPLAYGNDIQEWLSEAATMLRQQQAEIEALKQIIDANNLSQNIGQFVKPAKTLTDEEIMNIFNNWINNKQEHNLPANNQNYFYQEMREFARAILRKAQEK
ncbi:hypothetical protein UFOVP1019_28 [uncultured Caudovirales phage]|uniref:Uncharacterized protein n=1 Tax=uncultured Caudovirales phage TaxID=2100421 RepID=A0A6J5PMM9_9CAUD|nr:hypothetical protein UFOVP846_58 [uncultured Caudovirales phage]CAB4173109.1 hypothetical protein UFOVP940_30 [uncultured Caudovirales phage]CAB4178627.1 hypothetical protein UFOVP1019_28 [uncultured Caudovirales phage]CAB4219455.1 hypothetical protein UFOVP1618_2 [uncultured Caudovirales phage]